MADIVVVDLEGAVRAWLNAQTDLVGRGKPVTNGFILGEARSPGDGVIGVVSLGAGGSSEIADARRVVVTVRASGRQGPEQRGPRAVVEKAARATYRRLVGLDSPVTVTTAGGDVVQLLYVDPETAQGPTPAGDLGGEIAYTLDALVVARAG